MFKTKQEFMDHINKLKNDPEYKQQHTNQRDELIKQHWLTLKPFLKAEDVPDLPKIGEKKWKDFFIPILIKNGAIPKKDLKDRIWYYGEYRNSNFGKWNEIKNKFDIIRHKFGYRWDDCNHFEDDDGYALFVPLREATEEEIITQENLIK